MTAFSCTIFHFCFYFSYLIIIVMFADICSDKSILLRTGESSMLLKHNMEVRRS